MLDCHPQIISKIVLAIVAPHYGITFLMRLGAGNPSDGSNTSSANSVRHGNHGKQLFNIDNSAVYRERRQNRI